MRDPTPSRPRPTQDRFGDLFHYEVCDASAVGLGCTADKVLLTCAAGAAPAGGAAAAVSPPNGRTAVTAEKVDEKLSAANEGADDLHSRRLHAQAASTFPTQG